MSDPTIKEVMGRNAKPDQIGNDAWNTPVTQWDRDAYADFATLGSHHESVMPLRERIERGDHDDMPMLRVVAYARTRMEQQMDKDA